MTFFDIIAQRSADDECRLWIRKVLDAVAEIAEFTAKRIQRGRPIEVVKYCKGSFNFGLQIRFDTPGPDAIIRFPKAGHSKFRDEKVENEVNVLKLIHEKTTIPLPRLLSWGLTAESPQGLGPFIIMDYVEGSNLFLVLGQAPQEEDDDDYMLKPDVDEKFLATIYDQVADFMLQLYQLNFPAIGAISLSDDGTQPVIRRRPLTYAMHELSTMCGFPDSEHLSSTYDTESEFFKAIAAQNLIHLKSQRNITFTKTDAKRRFTARHLFADLAEKLTSTNKKDSFKLYCDDFRFGNMLVDEKTMKITAVIDWEFANAMPARFSYNPPSWLLLTRPHEWLEAGKDIAEFMDLYRPRLEQFMSALQDAESRRLQENPETQCMSSEMRDTWDRGSHWFELAALNPLDVDLIFYAQLNQLYFDGAAGPHALGANREAQLDDFAQMKVDQSEQYRKDRDADDELRKSLQDLDMSKQ